MKRKFLALFALLLMMGGIYTVVAGPASATIPYSTPVNSNCGDSEYCVDAGMPLFNGPTHITRYYHPGDYTSIITRTGNCSAPRLQKTVWQGDGNLVEYYNGTALWSSHTDNLHGGVVLALQADGNVVVYGINSSGGLGGVKYSMGYSNPGVGVYYNLAPFFLTDGTSVPIGIGWGIYNPALPGAGWTIYTNYMDPNSHTLYCP